MCSPRFIRPWYGGLPIRVNAFRRGALAITPHSISLCTPQHASIKHLHSLPSRVTLPLRLLLLYRLWVVKRSQGHTCGHFFVRQTALQSCRTTLEDGRGSVEGLGTWASDSSNVVISRNAADGEE